MLSYPLIPEEQLLKKLKHPGKKVRMVLDTDTFNEIDDQFAVTYAVLSQNSLSIEAFYAAPFLNELSTSAGDGMEKSYQELLRLRKILKCEDIPVFRGSTSFMDKADQPVHSEAALDLVARAMATDKDDPLYVVAIGAITNVASAIAIEPAIIERIVILWLGGHALHWPNTKEFNLYQDIHASRIIMDCGAPLVLIPCYGVSSELKTTLSEIRDYVQPHGELGQYLYQTYEDCNNDHFAYSRVIWDISVIGWLINPEWFASTIEHSPIISDDFRWSTDGHRHFVRYVYKLSRDQIFRDMFTKIADYAK